MALNKTEGLSYIFYYLNISIVRKSAGISPAKVHSNNDLYVSAGSYYV